MTSPPADDVQPNGGSPSDRDDRDPDRDESARRHDAGISARDTSTASRVDDTVASEDPVADDRETGPTAGASTPAVDDPVGDLLPHASVDSRWWYWIAAIPLYVVLGGVLAVLFVGAFIFDLFLTGGLATVFGAFIVIPLLGLVGLVLTVLFPVATYIDARAIAESDAEWTPDPLVWGLAALATVVLSAFLLSVLQALYYLYRRHVAVGTP
ncbi:hypothetical protein [Halobellus marinus]|uniref:hypothetical protein n=1 Tax=Halobellus TaxID=1073986 RepID=UPI0028AE64AF|nr:hypothetical protein [Halobellus sp. DFY28]